MLGIANTLADFFAFNLLPKGHSELLKTFRQEKVRRRVPPPTTIATSLLPTTAAPSSFVARGPHCGIWEPAHTHRRSTVTRAGRTWRSRRRSPLSRSRRSTSQRTRSPTRVHVPRRRGVLCRSAAHTHPRTHPRTHSRAHPRADSRKVLDAPDIVRVLASAVGDEDEQVPRYMAEPCMMAADPSSADDLHSRCPHACVSARAGRRRGWRRGDHV